MNVDEYMVVQPSREIKGEWLLEVLGLELKFSEQWNSQSGEDQEEVRNNMDFGGEL